MNFVINIPGDRKVGIVDALEMRSGPSTSEENWQVTQAYGVNVHYRELRRDLQTGRCYVALVYELPDVMP